MSLGLQTQIRPRSSRRPECFHLSLACTPLSTLVEQFGKGLPSSGQRPFCPCLPSGQFCAGEATSGGGPRAQNPLPGEGPPPAEPRGKLEAQGAWGLRRRAGRQRARTGRRAPDPALALTSPSLLHRPSSTSVSGPWHSQHQTSRWLWRREGGEELVGSRGREEEAQLTWDLTCSARSHGRLRAG